MSAAQEVWRRGLCTAYPVTIKVNVDQAGHATTNGLPALKDAIASADAPIVENLQRAGAVVIGRTNTPEFSFRAETDNPLHGRTINPWGDHVSPGGSSGGAGAAVMAGIGGPGPWKRHRRQPAVSGRRQWCRHGQAGLGRVAAWNPSQKAERGMLAQAMSVQGIIARTVRDLRLSMPTAISPDPRDPFHVPLPYEGPSIDGPIRVAFTRETYEFDLHPEVSAALDTARHALTDAGYLVEEREPPLLREAASTGFRALMGEVRSLMGPDVRAHGSGLLNDIFDEYYRQFPPFEGAEQLQMMAKRSHYARQWSLFLDKYPLVLTPFMLQPTFRPLRDTEGAEGVREVLGSAIYSYSMNFMGLPAGCVPARLAHLPQGELPISVQLVGRRWREDLIVNACEAIETRVGVMADHLFRRGV